MASTALDPITTSTFPASHAGETSTTATYLRPNAQESDEILNEDTRTLREQYDQEELDRFLILFSAYVSEVRVPDDPDSANQLVDENDETSHVLSSERYVDAEKGNEEIDYDKSHRRSLSEEIAQKYVVPNLPPLEHQKPPDFTLTRFKLTIQRLLLSTMPLYGPFLGRMKRLATWQDQRTSLFWCTAFWVLWIQDLLLPALFLRILIALLRRRLSSYPTHVELAARRADVARAQSAGGALFARLSSPAEGSARGAAHVARKKVIGKMKNTRKEQEAEEARKEGEEDMPQVLLTTMHELADFHERINNLFQWRKPSASRFYAWVFGALFIYFLTVPAAYIAKITYATLGILFWHIIPVILALPPRDRARLPRPLADVPTDTDYAIDLMSDRVAHGKDVRPSGSTAGQGAVPRSEGTSALSASDKRSTRSRSTVAKVINWLKPSRREQHPDPTNRTAELQETYIYAAQNSRGAGRLKLTAQAVAFSPVIPLKISTDVAGLSQITNTTHITNDKAESSPEISPVDSDTTLITAPAMSPGHSVFPDLPAQETTITQPDIEPTPMHTSRGGLLIPLDRVRRVKKIGALGARGLTLEWEDDSGAIKKERFWWVHGRDEAFARLVGGQKRWVRV